jgi:hypothetical protein
MQKCNMTVSGSPGGARELDCQLGAKPSQLILMGNGLFENGSIGKTES